jgi:hypothetical protein
MIEAEALGSHREARLPLLRPFFLAGLFILHDTFDSTFAPPHASDLFEVGGASRDASVSMGWKRMGEGYDGRKIGEK